MPSRQTGINAVEYLYCKMTGKKYLPTEYKNCLLTAKSCGCEESPIQNHSAFLPSPNDMVSRLICANDIEELMHSVAWYTYRIKPFSAFMLCLSENWADISESGDDCGHENYHDNMHLRLTLRGEKGNIENLVFDKSQLLPETMLCSQKPAAYYFYSLQFLNKCFGYSVITFEGENSVPAENFSDWIGCVSNGLECLRRLLRIQMMYDKLKIAAETDSLTGLYNRNAFNFYVDKLTENGGADSRELLFIMVDLNHLKVINDTFGHLAGDEAIRTVATAINSVCNDSDRCFRFGGDEFMIIGEYYSDRIFEISDGINSYLESYNLSSDNPFTVTASIGGVNCKISADTEIDSIIKAADSIMYLDKQQKKKSGVSPIKQ
jgi:diguanylate cyclase (GGDEF)-like protein